MLKKIPLLYCLGLFIGCSPEHTTAWNHPPTPTISTRRHSLGSQNRLARIASKYDRLLSTQIDSTFHSYAEHSGKAKSALLWTTRTRSTTTKLGATSTAIANNLPLANSPKAVIAISVISHVLGGSIGTPFVIRATRGPFSWYRKISLPSWTPPDAIFGPVWSTLYTCMGLAMGRLWNATALNPHSINVWTLGLWAVHFIINILWAPVFFGMKKIRVASIMNGILISTLVPVIALLFLFLQPSPQPLSAVLLLPYLGWLTFATFLNASICKRNPTDTKFGGYNEARLQADLAKLQQRAAKYAFGK